MSRSTTLEELAGQLEAAAKAFDALDYTAQFAAISGAVNLEWGGTAIGVSPSKFIATLRERAAALRASQNKESEDAK